MLNGNSICALSSRQQFTPEPVLQVVLQRSSDRPQFILLIVTGKFHQQDLDRHLPLQIAMLTEIHFGESTRAETPRETIVPRLLARLNTIDHGCLLLTGCSASCISPMRPSPFF